MEIFLLSAQITTLRIKTKIHFMIARALTTFRSYVFNCKKNIFVSRSFLAPHCICNASAKTHMITNSECFKAIILLNM